MAKAIAIKTIYLVVVIAMIVFFTVMGFTNFIPSILGTIEQVDCTVRASNYCDECRRGQCPNWEDFAPGCTEIDEPSLEDCGITPVVLEDCSSECQDLRFASGECVASTGETIKGMCIGPYDISTDNWDDQQIQHIKDWGANAVLVETERTDDGFLINKFGEFLGWGFYDQIVEETHRLGMTLFIRLNELHWKPRPWSEDWYSWIRDKDQWIGDLVAIASRYKNYNHIYYELYNEPGGQPTLIEFQSYMQDAIDAIEAVNPNAKFSVQGLRGRGYEFGSMGSILDYPLYSNREILYSNHMYIGNLNSKGINALDIVELEDYFENTLRWKEARNKGLKFHVGEFGIGKTSDTQALDKLKNFYNYMNKYDIGFLVWWWHPYASNPDGKVLADWNGNPASPYGIYVQSQLTGESYSEGNGCQGKSIGQDGCPSGQTCCCSGTAPPPTDGEFRPLHVDEKYVKNDLDQTVILRGISGPAPWWWDSYGDGVEQTLGYAKSWGVNVYRATLTWSSYYEDGYAYSAVERAIEVAKELGIYIIIGEWSSTIKSEPELGWEKFKQYWERFASEHKDDWHILYNVLNEPYTGSDGSLTPSEYQSHMEETTDLIRKHVPDAVVVIDGLEGNYGGEYNYLTSLEFLKTNPIRRDNILYDVHVYGSKESAVDWWTHADRLHISWALENDYAVIIGETNIDASATTYWWEDSNGVWVTEPEQIYWWDQGLTELDNRQLGYLGWAFIPKEFPPLIKDWHGTPNQAGDVLKRHLEKTISTIGWGFIPEGYEIIFADDVEQTTWDGTYIGEGIDNPNLQPWQETMNNWHDNADLWHKIMLKDNGGKWFGDGDDWYSTTIARSGTRSFRIHRDGQYPNDGDRSSMSNRWHSEYLWYGWWIYFPEDFYLDEGWFTFGGFSESTTIDGARYALYRELTLNRDMDVRINYRKQYHPDPDSEEGKVSSEGGLQYIYTIPLGQWVNLGMLIHWDETDGWIDYYFNGEKVYRFDENTPGITSNDVTHWKGDKWVTFTMKHYSHEEDYETVYWDDLVFAVPEGTTDW